MVLAAINLAAILYSLSPRRRLFWGALLISLITCLLYARTLGYPLLFWDDDENILRNPLVLAPGLVGLKAIFTAPFSTDFYPLTYLSLALDHWWWGGRLVGYHVTQVLLHAANAFLFAWLAWRWTQKVGAALLAGAWFAWHPLQVETVAWLAERKSVLGTCLMLLALLAYLRADESPRVAWWRLASLGLFLLAVLSHALVIVMPVLLVAYELTVRGTRLAETARRTWLFFLPAAFGALMRVLGHGESGQLGRQFPDFFTGVLTMTSVSGQYLNSLFWPVHLNNYYIVRPARAVTDPGVLVALAWVAAWAGLVWRMPKWRRWLVFAALWFLLALLPVSQLVPHPTLRADRYLYIAALALLVLAAQALQGQRWLRAVLGPVSAVALFGLTIARIPDWRDARTLWSDCVAKNPRTTVAWFSLAGCDIRDGNWRRAEANLREALKLNPTLAEAHARLGTVLVLDGRKSDAVAEFRRALALDPNLAEAKQNLEIIERSP